MFHLLKDGCIRRAKFIWNNLIHSNPADAIVPPFLRYPVPDNPKPFLVNIFPLKRSISQLPLRFATEHGVKHGIFRFYNKPHRARPSASESDLRFGGAKTGKKIGWNTVEQPHRQLPQEIFAAGSLPAVQRPFSANGKPQFSSVYLKLPFNTRLYRKK